jgi:hypothetical protein
MTTGYISNNLDLSEIFQSGKSSIITGYKISNDQDIGELFSPWDGTTQSKASVTGYTVNGTDLNEYFNSIKAIPYTIEAQSYLTSQSYTNSTYTGLIFNQSGNQNDPNKSTPSEQLGQQGSCIFTINSSSIASNVNILIIGGGGSGSAGNYDKDLVIPTAQGGGGAGGAGIIYFNNYTLPINVPITISVGYSGLGRNPGNGGGGNSAGLPGSYSSISYSDNGFTANPGLQGYGIGTTFGRGGGLGGNIVLSSTGSNIVGYGGGGGGGAGSLSDSQTDSNIPGTGGDGSIGLYNGINGTTGNNVISRYGGTGAKGGSSGLVSTGKTITLPFVPGNPILYGGNAGGGGGNKKGGLAGGTIGGSGSSSTTSNGTSSLSGLQLQSGTTTTYSSAYYGNGGGGGGTYIDTTYPNAGGNGSRGVVMIWWQN